MVAPSEARLEIIQLAEILQVAISLTLDYTNSKAADAVQPVKNNLKAAAGVTASSALLLQHAYQSVRGIEKPHLYKVAAINAAAILAVQPLRVVLPDNVSSKAVVVANQHCALRATTALLGIDILQMEGDFLRRLYRANLQPPELPYLRAHLKAFDRLDVSAGNTFDHDQLQDYDAYNADYDISWDEIDKLENLITVFMLLQRAFSAAPALV